MEPQKTNRARHKVRAGHGGAAGAQAEAGLSGHVQLGRTRGSAEEVRPQQLHLDRTVSGPSCGVVPIPLQGLRLPLKPTILAPVTHPPIPAHL